MVEEPRYRHRPSPPMRTSSRDSAGAGGGSGDRSSLAMERARSTRVMLSHLEFQTPTSINRTSQSPLMGHHYGNDGGGVVDQFQKDRSDDHLSVAASDDIIDDNDNPINEELCALYREAKQIEDMTRGDITGLRTWRLIVILVILITYVGATTGTFLILRSEEQDDTEERYVLFTRTIRETSGIHMARFRQAMTSLSHSVTAAGRMSPSSSKSFPFVRVSHFEALAAQAQSSARVELITWNPLVTQPNAWSDYVSANPGWYDESRATATASIESDQWDYLSFHPTQTWPTEIWTNSTAVSMVVNDTTTTTLTAAAVATPIWHCSPPQFAPYIVNYNLLAEGYMSTLFPVLSTAADGVLSAANPPNSTLRDIVGRTTAENSAHQGQVPIKDEGHNELADQSQNHPYAWYLEPVYAELYNRSSSMVGFLAVVVPFDQWLRNLLPDDIFGIDVVLRNNCGQSYSYHLRGPEAEYVGEGDWHDLLFDDTETIIPLITFSHNTTAGIPGHCTYSFSVYLSSDFNSEESSNLAAICTVALIIVFLIMAIVFFLFDRFIRRRNVEAVKAAAQSNAIVSSLFPEKIKQRLFAEHDKNKESHTIVASRNVGNNRTNSDMDEREIDYTDFMFQSKPIADLFPETTILCADIVGFTAWSSVRDPSQVFVLLETLFREFDALAKKRRVFKVETIGDCYVAVTGLPEPRKDHALVMSRFANECLNRMNVLTRKLEARLGPDTGELSIRMGLHSGPVTAGVLRGDRSRFQLFGETMNTAARMESTGLQNRIHISQETADLLSAAGKTNWISKRRDVVQSRGLVEIQTYWLNLSHRAEGGSAVETASISLTDNSRQTDKGDDFETGEFDGRTTRLIEWNVDVLLRLLKQMEAQRRSLGDTLTKTASPNELYLLSDSGRSMMDEAKEALTLPKHKVAAYDEDPENIVLDPAIAKEMYSYVASIASLYRNNAFHNFEHASHVVMSMVKLLSRVVPSPGGIDSATSHEDKSTMLADAVHTLTSDPLNQFSFVFSALILDVDHPGVSNHQLVKERSNLALKYKKVKVTEQNAVHSAWTLLMEDRFATLRHAIYQSYEEMKRFRQLLVHVVMVSDVADSETKTSLDLNLQATAVIDCLVQATCVSHTMQHWHIYRKWNKKYFQECHEAYAQARSKVNPASSWYETELAFFDDHVIPLASRLKECGVFGTTSEEFLHCATRNRNEWVTNGREAVNEMKALIKE